ncbi:MAG TPA: hypothetical protein DCY97_21400 [Marinilabiliales bacterium]|nr:hypothetical protein [Marinilabiliales bacterium]
MKRFTFIALFTLSLGFAFTSCNSDDDSVTYWYNYGTYIETMSNNQGFVVELDSGDTLVPSQIDYLADELEDSSRVMAYFSIDSETENVIHSGYLELYRVLTKDIIQLTEENQDSIGNDGVSVNENTIWLTEYHLNVVFSYYGGSITHYINLVKPIQDTVDDEGRLILELRHNNNNDPSYNVLTGVVSFDMRSLYQPGMDSVNFLFKSTDYYDVDFTWEGTYYFESQTLKSVPANTSGILPGNLK